MDGASPEEESVRGVVRWFSVEKGYGLIDAPGGCYVVDHRLISQGLANGTNRPNDFRFLVPGVVVSFSVERDGNGRCRAAGVRVTSGDLDEQEGNDG